MTFFSHAKILQNLMVESFEVMATGCFVQVIYTKGVTDRPVMVQAIGKPGVFKGETPEG